MPAQASRIIEACGYGSRVARSLSSGARSRDPLACPGRRGRSCALQFL